MQDALTIVARIEAKPESIELVKSELIKLIAPTRSEEGCLLYELHQDNEQPEVFLFFERWESRELWQVHMNAEPLKAFGAATDGAVESVVINEMFEVD